MTVENPDPIETCSPSKLRKLLLEVLSKSRAINLNFRGSVPEQEDVVSPTVPPTYSLGDVQVNLISIIYDVTFLNRGQIFLAKIIRRNISARIKLKYTDTLGSRYPNSDTEAFRYPNRVGGLGIRTKQGSRYPNRGSRYPN